MWEFEGKAPKPKTYPPFENEEDDLTNNSRSSAGQSAILLYNNLSLRTPPTSRVKKQD